MYHCATSVTQSTWKLIGTSEISSRNNVVSALAAVLSCILCNTGLGFAAIGLHNHFPLSRLFALPIKCGLHNSALVFTGHPLFSAMLLMSLCHSTAVSFTGLYPSFIRKSCTTSHAHALQNPHNSPGPLSTILTYNIQDRSVTTV